MASPLLVRFLYIKVVKNFLYLLAVVFVFVAGDRLAAVFLQKQTAASQLRYSRLYNGSGQADLLLAGNSRGLTFYQPYIEEKTGLSTLNISYNGLPAEVAACLLLDYVDRYPAPRALVIDITLCDRSNDELMTAFTTYSEYSPRIQTLLQQKLPKVWWGAQVSHLFRYNNEVFQRALYYRNRSDEDWLLDRVITDRLAAQVDSMKYGMNPDLAPPLERTLTAFREKGIRVVPVISPYFPGFSKNIAHLDELKARIEANTGLTVLDFRDALTDPADFGDLQHPNKRGSIRYMDLLFEKIK